MTEYMIPEQPDVSTVWDVLGQKWEYEKQQLDGWLWDNSLTGESIDWDGLLANYGPVTDYPPEPDHGTRWVNRYGDVLQWRRNEHGAGLHSPKCGDDCAANDGWERAYRLVGPLTPYVEPEPEPEPVPEPDPWEDVKPGRLYWVTGHSKFYPGKVRGLAIKDSERDLLRGDSWFLMRSNEDNRLQSAVELTAVPTHLLDALIETVADYDDPEDGNSVLREAVYDVTDWLADHPQNKETT